MTFRVGLDPLALQGDRDVAKAVRQMQAPPILRVVRDTSDQALTASTITVVQFNTTSIDTHSWWDSTNYRYTPQEAGYFRVSVHVPIKTDASALSRYAFVYLYKSGVNVQEVYSWNDVHGLGHMLTINQIVQCNGTTDYIDVRAMAPDTATGWSVGGSISNRASLCIDFLGSDALL